MAMTVGDNVTALRAQHNLNRSLSSLAQATDRLSSGKRINNAKDDAAGFSIAIRLNTQSRGLTQANRNIGDGISLLKSAESGYNQANSLLQRMRELAVQSANGTYDDTNDRTLINNEFADIISEIDRIANTTSFNGIALLDGTNASVDLQVGRNNSADDQIAVSLTDTTTATLGVDSATVDTQANAQAAIALIDTALTSVTTALGTTGTGHNRLEAALESNTSAINEAVSAHSRIMDADMASESSAMTSANILAQAGTAMLGQANASQQLALSLIG